MQAEFQQNFGGDWTELKLRKVKEYLTQYALVMKNQNFACAYIDAFAGTGYRTLKSEASQEMLPYFEMTQEDSQRFMDGSARIALKIEPKFSKYIFVEKDPTRFSELENLRIEFPHLAQDIVLRNQDANEYIQQSFKKDPRRLRKMGRRAVMFLDPFGMQVKWKTLEIIASTQAIDLWFLFPLGVAVNRMLPRNAEIQVKWQERLTDLFGTEDWRTAFYETRTELTLFGEVSYQGKVVDPFSRISEFFVERLKTIFAGVAENPLPLYNSRGNPLYLLCFAVGNPRGKSVALRIANHILGG